MFNDIVSSVVVSAEANESSALKISLDETRLTICRCPVRRDEEKRMATKTAKKPKQRLKIVPLGDKVVLRRAEAESKTSGGIVLPDTAQNRPQKGEVIAVGDGHVRDDGKKVPLTVKEGDRVIFSSYAGDEIRIGDEDFLLLRESDILATF
jgi:chaperonin GroES